jgi:DNA processing protein
VESAEKGGSLITADIAFSYSRDVFAFPGKATDLYSSGCNKLIKLNKAGLITCAADLIAAMRWEDTSHKEIQTELPFEENDDNNPITTIIRSKKEIHINELAITLEMTISELSVQLFELEMEGKIKALPGGRYKLT